MTSLTLYSALYGAAWLVVFSHHSVADVVASTWALLLWLGTI